MNKFKLLGAGIFASFLSVFSFFNLSEIGMFFLPGTIFGVIIIIALLSKDSKKNLTMKLFWILGSTLAYFIAVKTFGSITTHNPSPFMAGIVGSIIMLVFFRFTFFKFSYIQLGTLTFLGGILSFSIYITPFSLFLPKETSADFLGGIIFLFPIWQGGMAFAMGWIMDRSRNQLLV